MNRSIPILTWNFTLDIYKILFLIMGLVEFHLAGKAMNDRTIIIFNKYYSLRYILLVVMAFIPKGIQNLRMNRISKFTSKRGNKIRAYSFREYGTIIDQFTTIYAVIPLILLAALLDAIRRCFSFIILEDTFVIIENNPFINFTTPQHVVIGFALANLFSNLPPFLVAKVPRPLSGKIIGGVISVLVPISVLIIWEIFEITFPEYFRNLDTSSDIIAGLFGILLFYIAVYIRK